jgi:hypothetical protein
LQILLLQRINTGNLSALQIDLAARWLCAWSPALQLPEALLEARLADLGLGDGLLTKKPQGAQGQLLYLTSRCRRRSAMAWSN